MKKLTLLKGKAMACLILMCFFFVQSCKKDFLQPNSKDLQNGLSIAEAKKYFEANVKQVTKAKKLMSSGNVTPTTDDESAEAILNNKELIWESAYQKLISTGNAVKIPLNFGKTYAVVDAGKKELIPFGSLNYLFMYKDSLQKIHTEWVILLPDKAWLYGKRDQYTGKIVVKDWEGNFIKSYDYKGTVSVKGLSMLPNKTKSLVAEAVEPPIPPTDPTDPDVWVICVTKCHEFCDRTIIDSRKCIMITEGGGGDGGGDDGNGGTNKGGSKGNGASNGGPGGGTGGGGAGAGDYTPSPNCNPDPNYIMPNYPPPSGYSWIMPCNGPGNVPIPAEPMPDNVFKVKKLDRIINFMGITDADKQNFLLTHDDIYQALETYLVTNTNTPENKEFVNQIIEQNLLLTDITRSAINVAQLNDIPNINSLLEQNEYIQALKIYNEFQRIDLDMNNPSYDFLDGAWLKRMLEAQRILGNLATLPGKVIAMAIRLDMEQKAERALTRTALIVYPQLLDNQAEYQKQVQFNTNAEHSVAIMLFEFATGTGLNNRNFGLSQPITQKYLEAGNKQRLINEFHSKLAENSLTYNDFKSGSAKLKGRMDYSPDHAGIASSFQHHINSDLSRFFISGADVFYYPTTEDGWVDVEVYNETTIRSLFLHMGENYPRTMPSGNRPLSTIKQYYKFRLKIN